MPDADRTSRRPGATLYRYLLREVTFPTLFSLGGFTVAILTKDLLGYSNLVVNHGVGAGTVALVALFQAIPMMATTLPFAVLVGCLIGLGRLGADLEILSLEASGVSARRLVAPVTLFAALLTLVGLCLSLVVAPWAQRQVDGAFLQAALENPGSAIQPGRVNRFGDWKLEALEVSARGDEMRGVILWMPDVGETVFAERATVGPTEDSALEITLYNGSVVLNPRKTARAVRFERMRSRLPDSNILIERHPFDLLTSMTLDELFAIGADPERQPYYRSLAQIEAHRRVALPFAVLVFGFLVIPLFLSRKSFSRSGGGMMGVAATLIYYGLLQLGDGLIQRELLSIAAGVWLPNLVMAVVGLLLFLSMARRTTFSLRSEPGRLRREPRVREGSEGRIRVRWRALPRYVAGRFLQVAALCLFLILVAYLAVDVLDRLQWFFKYGATADEMLRFYVVRIPLLASRVVPMALLVATALTVSMIAAQGELTGMRACGIPAPRAMFPVLLLSAVVAPLYFLLADQVVPRTNALADYLKTVEIKDRTVEHVRTAVWFRVGRHVYQMDRMEPRVGRAREIVIYELGEDGLPVSRIDARSAASVGDGVWRLEEPVRVELADGGLQYVPAGPYAQLGADAPSYVDPMHLSIAELGSEIREIESAGFDATRYRVNMHVKIAQPFACLILPAVALLFAMAGPPYPSSALTLVGSVIVAVLYTLGTGVGASLGYGGVLPPPVAGWASTAFFAALMGGLWLRLRSFGQTF